MAYDADPDALAYAQQMFKEKWWRKNTMAAAEHRSEYIAYMHGFQHRVWNPTNDDGTSSRRCRITWHSLESLVWSFVTTYTSDFDDVNFGDLYLYFCRLPLLTHVRQHSTSGSVSKETYRAKRSSSASR